MQFDATDVIVALLGASATIAAVVIPIRWGRKANEAVKSGSEASREMHGLSEQREHDRTREMIREQTNEIRSLFTRLELLLFGVRRGDPPGDG